MSPTNVKILRRRELAERTVELIVESPLVALRAQPGQFVILRPFETSERIPLTIADFERDKGTITIVFLIVGRTTEELAELGEGESIIDFVGPLGNPTRIERAGNVVCVGGGVGIAACYPVAKGFKQAGNSLVSIIGAKSNSSLFWEEEMTQVSDELIVCTDDGSGGKKGFVTDALRDLLDSQETDLVFAVGPTVMMRAVAELTKPLNIRTIVSLNPIMIDGTGMCGGCRVRVGGEVKFTCVDGPDFDAHKVDFDYLLLRQRIYIQEEETARKCRQQNESEG